MPSLSDKLKALGVKVGAQDLPIPPPKIASPLQAVLGGRPLETPLGETFVVEQVFSSGYMHGGEALNADDPLDALAAWAGDERIAKMPRDAFAFLDTETTGLSGGSGTYAFLIGVGRLQDGAFHLAQYFMSDPSTEIAQLAALEAFLAPCQALVTFNGKSFDAPLLNTRFLFHGWASPLPGLVHLDLLHLARRLWRERLPSRTLANLEVQIINQSRTEEDIPGWAIPQMYFDFLRSGDVTPLKRVFYHNAMDVVSLAALFNHTARLLSNPFSPQIEHNLDLAAIARLHEDLGQIESALSLYQHCLELHDQGFGVLPEHVLQDALARLAQIHKRRDDYSSAIPYWERLASYHEIQAHVELAKCYEHHQSDLHLAIYWTETAIQILSAPGASFIDRLQVLPELQHRLDRLQRKIKPSPRSEPPQ
jgi:hypothetical protein